MTKIDFLVQVKITSRLIVNTFAGGVQRNKVRMSRRTALYRWL